MSAERGEIAGSSINDRKVYKDGPVLTDNDPPMTAEFVEIFWGEFTYTHPEVAVNSLNDDGDVTGSRPMALWEAIYGDDTSVYRYESANHSLLEIARDIQRRARVAAGFNETLDRSYRAAYTKWLKGHHEEVGVDAHADATVVITHNEEDVSPLELTRADVEEAA